ncbi:MAG: hypothetical protein ACYC6L_07080 [Anaerolineae bacterium]
MINTKKSTGWFWSGEEPEWLVVITVLVALVIGGLVMYLATGRTQTARVNKLSVRYPAQWVLPGEAQATSLEAQDLASQASVRVSIVGNLDPAAPVTMEDLVTMRAFELAQATELFRVLATKAVQVDAQAATEISYAFVLDSAVSSYLNAVPKVIRGVDYLVPYQGQIYLISYQDDANSWQQNVFEQIRSSIKLH